MSACFAFLIALGGYLWLSSVTAMGKLVAAVAWTSNVAFLSLSAIWAATSQTAANGRFPSWVDAATVLMTGLLGAVRGRPSLVDGRLRLTS